MGGSERVEEADDLGAVMLGGTNRGWLGGFCLAVVTGAVWLAGAGGAVAGTGYITLTPQMMGAAASGSACVVAPLHLPDNTKFKKLRITYAKQASDVPLAGEASSVPPQVKLMFRIVARPIKLLDQDQLITKRKIHQSYSLPSVPVLKARSYKISGEVDNRNYAYGVTVCAEEDPVSPLDRETLFSAIFRYIHVVQVKYKAP